VTLAGLPPICLAISSLSSTRQAGLLLDFVAQSILQILLPVFTGYVHPSALYVQADGYRLLGSSWHYTSVLIRSATARCQSANEMPWPPPFTVFQSSRRLSITMCYRRRSIVCYCRPSALEQSTC